MEPKWTSCQPLGVNELETDAAYRYTPRATGPLIRKDEIRCCVRDCGNWLAIRHRRLNDPKAFCPDHGVSVSGSPTYIYRNYRDNFIIDIPTLERVKQLKVESWRLGNERSEDALSWNVFVGLAGLNGLRAAFKALTGFEVNDGPELYLWGIKISDNEPQVWDKLVEVRRELEKGVGWPTEPDVILRVPGSVLLLIEAKFGSPNGTLLGNEDRFGRVAEFLNRYPCAARKSDPLNREWIEAQPREKVLQQLLRNIIFAQWLADEGETPFVVNLVRASDESNVSERFAAHLAADSPVGFRRATWENLFQLPLMSTDRAKPLRCYLENKTNKLARAFEVPMRNS